MSNEGLWAPQGSGGCGGRTDSAWVLRDRFEPALARVLPCIQPRIPSHLLPCIPVPSPCPNLCFSLFPAVHPVLCFAPLSALASCPTFCPISRPVPWPVSCRLSCPIPCPTPILHSAPHLRPQRVPLPAGPGSLGPRCPRPVSAPPAEPPGPRWVLAGPPRAHPAARPSGQVAKQVNSIRAWGWRGARPHCRAAGAVKS